MRDYKNVYPGNPHTMKEWQPMTIDERYLNSLSVQELRSELKHSLEVQYGVLHALRDLPDFPPPFVLMHLSSAGKYPEDSNRGKALQRIHGLDVIPPKQECEQGAGLWERVRSALSGANPA